ncbi:MAG: UTP--glucose-1-phosphate uridylyltransferase [Myxococcales bacterium]|nr:MAG: UTP--glucose-1-phosphate uridylyltransferase [Myxococcales bacterium]
MQWTNSVQKLLEQYCFDEASFASLREKFRAGTLSPSSAYIEAIPKPPLPDDLSTLPDAGTMEYLRLIKIGMQSIARGEVASLILAGGMATRFGGKVKALVPVRGGKTFAEVKMQALSKIAHDLDRPLPVWWMSSFATHETLQTWLDKHPFAGLNVSLFSQGIAPRIFENGSYFDNGTNARQSCYAPGHGDTLRSLKRSKLLKSFLAQGGRYLFISNVDNLCATLDPLIVGKHIDSGHALSCEVAQKHPGDQGGAPAWVRNRLQVVEGFRFPPSFNQDSIPVFSTNTFIANAEALNMEYPLNWYAVRKNVDDHAVIQFEQLLGDLTSFIDTQFLLVSREGTDSRFEPMKTPAELEQRAPIVFDALKHRGIEL